jgi:hypothetical protein
LNNLIEKAIHQGGLTDPWLATDKHDLALAALGTFDCLM